MAKGIEKRENWLDIALSLRFRRNVDDPSDIHERREARLARLWVSGGLYTNGPTEEQQEQLQDFVEGIAVWAAQSATAKNYIAENIRERLSYIAPQKDDGLVMSRIRLDAWVARTKPGVRFRVNPRKQDDIEALVDGAGMHQFTTAEFFEFLRDPHPVRTCAYCDAPFAARANATYCSTGCRTLAARAAADGF